LLLSSFFDEHLVPYFILFLIIFGIFRFGASRSRQANEAYKKGGSSGLAKYLTSRYLKNETAENLAPIEVFDLIQRKIEDRKARVAPLEKIFSFKTVLITGGALMAVTALALLGHILLGLSQDPFIWLVVGTVSFFGLFMLIEFFVSMALSILRASSEAVLKLIDRARGDLASGISPEAPVTLPAGGFEATYVNESGRDIQSVRTELHALLDGSWFKPWMGSIPVFLLLAIQLFLTTGEQYGESSYDNPWLMFFLFALATAMEFTVALRFVYLAFVNQYAQKGVAGLQDLGQSVTSNPGAQFLLVMTAMGIVGSVFGFVLFFVCSSWPGSLVFHAVSLSYVFYFQLKLDSFIDRMAENVIYQASHPEEAIRLSGILKVARRIF
jgi:hypothetical protein